MAITSCENNIDQITKHQDEIITLSKSKEIVNDSKRSFYMLTTYSLEKNGKNEYFFKKKENVFYTLFRDSIQFSPDNVININKEDSKYQEEICNYYLKTSQILKSYGIESLSGEIYKKFPKLTIHLEDGGILIYQPNIDISKNTDFAGFKKIRDDWYLLK
jgi:predicted transcriptional regulator